MKCVHCTCLPHSLTTYVPLQKANQMVMEPQRNGQNGNITWERSSYMDMQVYHIFYVASWQKRPCN